MNSGFILRQLTRQVFRDKALIMLPNTYWAGDEADLLVIDASLRVIDVEIKISRADFRRDAEKSKWWQSFPWRNDPATGKYSALPKQPREWPRRVWKHYFAMPRDIWKKEMESLLPSQSSGVLLFKPTEHGCIWTCDRRAKPCREAESISAGDAIDIARLAGMRMWEVLNDAENSNRRLHEVLEAQKECA